MSLARTVGGKKALEAVRGKILEDRCRPITRRRAAFEGANSAAGLPAHSPPAVFAIPLGTRGAKAGIRFSEDTRRKALAAGVPAAPTSAEATRRRVPEAVTASAAGIRMAAAILEVMAEAGITARRSSQIRKT